MKYIGPEKVALVSWWEASLVQQGSYSLDQVNQQWRYRYRLACGVPLSLRCF